MYLDLWILIVGFIIAFILAFAIGANDVANSFGTSVGSKVLTLKKAVILAAVFETLGAVLLGQKVSHTIQKGIIDIDIYTNATEELASGQLSALIGSSTWLLVATFLGVPISGTHSIVGAVLGYSLIARGTLGIRWSVFGKIVASWFVSPLLSGMVSCFLFFSVNKLALSKKNTSERVLKMLPAFYGITFSINVFSILYEGTELLHFHKIPVYIVIITSLGVGFIVGLLVWFIATPILRRKIKKLDIPERNDPVSRKSKSPPAVELQILAPNSKHSNSFNGDQNDSSKTKSLKIEALLITSSESVQFNDVADDAACHMETQVTYNEIPSGQVLMTMKRSEVKDSPDVYLLFSFLQILTAVFGAFAHGGNDVSNAIGPLSALWLLYRDNTISGLTPLWVLAFGGAGISLGLFLLGRRVIKTMGEDLTPLTPSSGFCIELGAALTVLVASNAGIPVSTTHCKVGSVVFVGFLRARQTVDWALFRNIAFAWLVTVPVAGGLSAAAMAGLRKAVL